MGSGSALAECEPALDLPAGWAEELRRLLGERTKKSRRGGDPSGQMEPNRWASAIPLFNRSTVEPQAAFAPVLALDHSPITDSAKIGAVVLDGSIEEH